MRDTSIDEQAVLKVLLHAAKHPTSAVNGLLLGTAQPTGGALHITDAIPVCHSFITLTPVLEAALSQVEQYVKSQQQQQQQQGLRIVGYYQCNERLGDTELGVGRRIADRIEAVFPESVAVVLDSAALKASLDGLKGKQLLQLLVKDGGRGWIKAAAAGGDGGSGSGKGSFRCPSTEALTQRFAQCAAEGRHQELWDFEEHLDQVSRDWLNPGLLQGPA